MSDTTPEKPTTQTVWEYLVDQPGWLSPAAVAADLDLSVQKVSAALRKLAEMGGAEKTTAGWRALKTKAARVAVTGVASKPRKAPAVEETPAEAVANAKAVDGMAQEMADRVKRQRAKKATEPEPDLSPAAFALEKIRAGEPVALGVLKAAELVYIAKELDVPGVTARTKKADLLRSIADARRAASERSVPLEDMKRADLAILATARGIAFPKSASAARLRELLTSADPTPAAVIEDAVAAGAATVLETDTTAVIVNGNPTNLGPTGTESLADDSDTDALNNPPEDDEEPSNVVEGPWGTPAPDAAVSGDPDGVDGVLADLMATRPVSAPPAPAPRRERTPADGETRTRKEAGGVTVVKGNKATQWARGALGKAIDDVLMTAKAGVDFTATEVTKAINTARLDDTAPIAQAGAVKYALEKMVGMGTARRTSEGPKRYAGVRA
jgi:hypothetical protein